MNPARYRPRLLPEPLSGLHELALDLRWSWNHGADALWEAVDPQLWHRTGNPWLILESLTDEGLADLARKPDFVAEVKRQVALREQYLKARTWFSQHYGDAPVRSVAYFSMEFGLSEALPIYSGGLGILAGDHLKTASDLGVPLIGVGLLYQQGYFRQVLDAEGRQHELYPYNEPGAMPVMPVADGDGGWLRIEIKLPGRALRLRVWQVLVGRACLYLLDSNDLFNTPSDRGITAELYGGDSEMRLQQEIVLGIGGWRLIERLHPDCLVCHLNEGHAALAVLERARSFMRRAEQPFRVALAATRAGNIFTTHTPVAAGFDRFEPALFAIYVNTYAARLGITPDELVALGRADPADRSEPFNMAYLAIRGCSRINGVSRLHGEVSRHIFQPLFPRHPEHEVPIGHVTNGVHMPSWDSAEADALWTEACGKERWVGALENVPESLCSVSDEALWTMRNRQRERLIQHLRLRLERQAAVGGADAATVAQCGRLLDPAILTIGFARRFTAYKRPDLLLHDPARLIRILTDPARPLQLVVAGKAHPHDREGKRMVHEWIEFMRRPEVCSHAVFVQDYDMAVAAEMVEGVDLWVNTPRRPWEACGTSGMKILVNGGLNLSELDGWWAEAYAPEVGWALGDRREHDNDPAWDAAEAQVLYRIIEDEVVPAFYDRDAHGVPREWVGRMRNSMTLLSPRFSSNRMVREYAESYYLPAALVCQRRAALNGKLAVELDDWAALIAARWPVLRFGSLSSEHHDGHYQMRVQVALGDLDPAFVRVELYAEPRDGAACVFEMTRAPAGAAQGYLTYSASVPATRPASDYTPRIVPAHWAASAPLEAPQVLWYR